MEQDFNPKIVTIIQKSYTPAAPGVVSSAGADQRHERKQNFRLLCYYGDREAANT